MPISVYLSYSSFIIIFSNVLSFMIIETVFFWFIVGNNLEGEILKKIENINFLRDQEFVGILLESVKNSTDVNSVKIVAEEFAITRLNNNLQKVYQWILPPVSLISFFLALCIVVEFCHKKKFDKTDTKILCAIIFSFTTEIIFYYVVIFESELLSDVEFLEIILSLAQNAN